MWSDRFVVRDLSGIRPGFSISVVRRPVAENAREQGDHVREQEMSMHSPQVHPLRRAACPGVELRVPGESVENGHFFVVQVGGLGMRPVAELVSVGNIPTVLPRCRHTALRYTP